MLLNLRTKNSRYIRATATALLLGLVGFYIIWKLDEKIVNLGSSYTILIPCFLLMSPLHFREKGLFLNHETFVPWHQIESYEWGKTVKTLLKVTYSKKGKSKRIDLTIPDQKREEMLKILRERTSAKEVA